MEQGREKKGRMEILSSFWAKATHLAGEQ